MASQHRRETRGHPIPLRPHHGAGHTRRLNSRNLGPLKRFVKDSQMPLGLPLTTDRGSVMSLDSGGAAVTWDATAPLT